MGFLRIRTTVDERPGRLASLTAALAAKGGNILGLSVQTDADGTVDEFVTDIPAGAEAVREALEAAGGRRVQVVTATAHELTDEPTRVLLLASRLRAAPWRLPELLGELLRADDSRWVYGSEMSDLPDPTLLTVPVAARRAIRVRRAELPFTLTEAARAASFVRLAQPPSTRPGPVATSSCPTASRSRSGRSPRSTAKPSATCTTAAHPRLAGSATSPRCPCCRPGPSTGSATAAAATRSSPGTTGR
ncbi:ACT domain-containing protein [Streptosporangium lutulentum]